MNTCTSNGLRLGLIGLAALVLPCGQAHGQRANVKYFRESLNVDSGLHSNDGVDEVVAYANVISMPANSPWLRLGIWDADLGQGSYLVLRSLADADEQILDARTLEEWQYASALFNGGKVMVELHVAPGDHDVFVHFDQAIYGDPNPIVLPLGGPETLCGPDNRVASGDNRVGRMYLGGCTAWRITSGAFLTAGHCVDFDPDQGGPGLPDGILDLSGVIEFNVPAWPGVAPANDQYPVIPSSCIWHHDGANAGMNSVGEDWAVFRINPNSNTGLLPHQAYGFPFRMTRENPAAATNMRVTGFGSDGGAANFTNQTATGPYVGESFVAASDVAHEYQVDTEGGNSGSPIIWELNGLTVGIHTNAGCSDPVVPGQGNSGTSFENDQLEAALRQVISSNARFVDVGHPLRVAEEGNAYRPYSTVTLGVTNVPTGGVVSIVAGTYSAAAGNIFTAGADGKAMTFTAPCGSVLIGN